MFSVVVFVPIFLSFPSGAELNESENFYELFDIFAISDAF